MVERVLWILIKIWELYIKIKKKLISREGNWILEKIKYNEVEVGSWSKKNWINVDIWILKMWGKSHN